jgi:hypothetical protein
MLLRQPLSTAFRCLATGALIGQIRPLSNEGNVQLTQFIGLQSTNLAVSTRAWGEVREAL